MLLRRLHDPPPHRSPSLKIRLGVQPGEYPRHVWVRVLPVLLRRVDVHAMSCGF